MLECSTSWSIGHHIGNHCNGGSTVLLSEKKIWLYCRILNIQDCPKRISPARSDNTKRGGSQLNHYHCIFRLWNKMILLRWDQSLWTRLVDFFGVFSKRNKLLYNRNRTLDLCPGWTRHEFPVLTWTERSIPLMLFLKEKKTLSKKKKKSLSTFFCTKWKWKFKIFFVSIKLKKSYMAFNIWMKPTTPLGSR